MPGFQVGTTVRPGPGYLTVLFATQSTGQGLSFFLSLGQYKQSKRSFLSELLLVLGQSGVRINIHVQTEDWGHVQNKKRNANTFPKELRSTDSVTSNSFRPGMASPGCACKVV